MNNKFDEMLQAFAWENAKQRPGSCFAGKRIAVYLVFFFALALPLYWPVFFESAFQSVGTLSTATSKNKNKGKQLRPCQLEGIQFVKKDDQNWTATASRFSAPLPWTCREEVSNDYFLRFVEFQILECPPSYAASTFQLQASTTQSRIMGHVGDRHAVRGGCGVYNASVAVMDGSSNVTINLFWTSENLHYSNRMKDIEDVTQIKTKGLSRAEITALLSPERMAYLDRHLDRIPLFPVQFRFRDSQAASNPTLPDCSTIPIRDWVPAGVFKKDQNDTALQKQQGVKPWPFRSTRCKFPNSGLDRLNDKLSGLRIKFLGDSHGQFHMGQWRALMCPEMLTNETDYFCIGYDCPYRNNSFNVAYRFFRAIHVFKNGTIDKDMDGISGNWRKGDPESCRKILGLGLYNATIMLIPAWVFVYETQEGLDNIVVSIRSLVENCKESQPELFAQHAFLLQTTTAVDSYDLAPGDSWRGIHNYRLQLFSQTLERELGEYVDGIIPTFDLTYARSVDVRTTDGVHLPSSSYAELIQIQASAVLSAMQEKGAKQGRVASTESDLRWFVGMDLE